MGIRIVKFFCILLKYLGFYQSRHTSSSRKHYPTVIEELCHYFSLEDLSKATNNFDYRQRIGIGSRVYKGCIEHNGAPDYAIALKHIYGKSPQAILEFKNEIELLCQLRHPNLVSLLGYCDDKDEKILVYEYMFNGSLDRYLQGGNMEALSWKKRLEICIGVARGLHYLHTGTKRTIFHCDLKPCNILLDSNMMPKLSNFGFSLLGPYVMSKPKPIQVEIIQGTWGYIAPEHAIHGTVTDKCDVYSFGMVLLVVVCGELKQAIYLGRPILVEENIDPKIKGKIALKCWEVFMDITERCLKYEPDKRPTIGEVEVELEHALSLQEEADIRNTDGDYVLLSKTIINLQPESELEPAPSLHKEADNIEDRFPR